MDSRTPTRLCIVAQSINFKDSDGTQKIFWVKGPYTSQKTANEELAFLKAIHKNDDNAVIKFASMTSP